MLGVFYDLFLGILQKQLKGYFRFSEVESCGNVMNY